MPDIYRETLFNERRIDNTDVETYRRVYEKTCLVTHSILIGTEKVTRRYAFREHSANPGVGKRIYREITDGQYYALLRTGECACTFAKEGHHNHSPCRGGT